MSESSGPHSINHLIKGFMPSTAGKAAPGCTTKIANADKDGNGEVIFQNCFLDGCNSMFKHVFFCIQIQLGGRHVFMGYLNDPGNTASTIDPDGYLNSGDIGHIDKFGFIHITGRLKVSTWGLSLIILSF